MPELSEPAVSANFEKLKTKLRELFELDKADLDFGIYRVLRQRHAEITEFLDRHLEKTVRDALTSHGDLQNVQLKHDLEKAETAAGAAGIATEQSPKVMELREKLAKGADLEATADEVYSHLLTFFSRYYQGGDFLGLHRSTVHGREKYMIPYNGEEVKLIWANMNQYYIKSSELLRDYTFHIRKADLAVGELKLDDLPDESVVRFKLIEGDTEKDNRKPDGKTTRAFALDEEKPFTEDGNTLSVNFRYREHTSERNLQDKLNADTEKFLADSLPPRWKPLLFAADPTHQPKDKKDTRTILQKHLRGYTAKYSFDYFIHKDLGGFLRRELDFYIKNEVMHLDDIEEALAPKAEEYLSKIRAIRRCAMPVIQMIAQLEEFQKKLWLKKKFVVETRYCLTLDRVPEVLYPDICANNAQWTEWDDLVALAELKPARTPEFLKANAYLMLDTRHFAREFTLKLLASIEDLDASLNGVCFHSENFQALQLMQERYREQVKCVYIDPPYNTDDDANFVYKDSFEESSWLALMFDRLAKGRNLLASSGIVASHIDENEAEALRLLLNVVFGSSANLGTVVWDKRNPKGDAKRVATQNELIHYSIRDASMVGQPDAQLVKKKKNAARMLEKAKAIIASAGVLSEVVRKEFKQWVNSQDFTGGEKPYCLLDSEGDVYRPVSMAWPNKKRAPDEYFEPLIHPTTNKPCPVPERGWRNPPDTMRALLESGEILFGIDETTQPTRKYVLKNNLTENLSSLYYFGGSADDDFIGLGLSFPDYPKPVEVATYLIFSAASRLSSTVLDFFAGSGTTGHAVIQLNREDGGTRKFLLTEMGTYFDTVLVPRLKEGGVFTRLERWKATKPR